ncbi:MAG: hypothetical protein HRT80_14900 [Henriciella sp.]|nr:hypothetical protein [Henriciella sp.]
MAQMEGLRFSENSSREAITWSKTNPGIAVNVIVGTDSKITPKQIEHVLDQEFAEAGVSNVVYFYRQNDAPSTGVVYYYSGASDGPFILNEARDAARKSASQYLFQQSDPALRYNYPD